MSRGVNRVILIGNLGADPEIRYTAGGAAVANISIATSESWKDKESGEKQERTEWHKVVFFGRLAEIVAEYLKKGSQVYIEGSLRTNKWQDKEGNDRYTTEIIASEMQMLGNKGERTTGPAVDGKAADGAYKSGTSGKSAATGQAKKVPPPQDEFVDDDIPF